MKSNPRPSPPAPSRRTGSNRQHYRWLGLLLLGAVAFLPAVLQYRTASLPASRTPATTTHAPSKTVALTAQPDSVPAPGLDEGNPISFSGPVGQGTASGQEAAATPVRAARILVQPRPGLDPAALAEFHASLGVTVKTSFARQGGLQVLELPPALTMEQAAALYTDSGLVAYAEPDAVVRALAEPNDFRFWDHSLWNLKNNGIYGGTAGADIHATAAWDFRTSATGVTIAIIDTGMRMTHEDLVGNLWTNPGETGIDSLGRNKATNGVDDDGDGYIDDVHGINAITGSGNPDDDYGHGTHIAGIIGGMGNNSIGIAGVAWQATMMPLKFIDPAGNGTISDAIECIEYARAHGARVINACWGGYTFTSTALRNEVSSLASDGIIFVAAVGNDGINNDSQPLFPASYEFSNVIAVAASNRNDNRAYFSNYGLHTVDLAAPGDPVWSSWNGSDSDYRYFSGTSMAAPHVTAAVALLEAQYPAESMSQIINRILSTTDPLTDFAGKSVTGGRLNLGAAMQAGGPPPPPPIAPTISGQPTSLAVVTGASATFSVTASGTPAPGYQWRKNSVAISGATNSSLTINNVQSADAGSYDVIVSNSGGSVTSASASLTVQGSAIAPSISSQPVSATVAVGATASFSVTASGTPAPAYQWRKNSVNISGAVSPSLSIANAQTADAGSYDVVVSNSAGSVTSASASLTVQGTVVGSGHTPSDFNGDSHPDLVWENTNNGDRVIWYMSGTTRLSYTVFAQITPDWQIVGTADFNHDGNTDLVWQNSSGARVIWFMSGSTRTSYVIFGQLSTNWQIVGTADFNHDGESDILLQNNATGERAVWFMSGATPVSFVVFATLGADWQMAATADFNGDGETDIVWQNINTGDRLVWLMSGTTRTSFVWLPHAAPSWQIVGARDFNADGNPDLILQDTATGNRSIWYMSGTTRTSETVFATIGPDWVIAP